MACRTRHLRLEDLHPLLLALSKGWKPESIELVEAALAQARWVYRRYRGDCSERRRREAAQLLVDLASLKPLGGASAALAALAASIFLVLNREPLPPPHVLVDLATTACDELDPEKTFEKLSRASSLRINPRNLLEALKALESNGYLQRLLAARCQG
ncbi:MAG: hypothetical protein F7B17_02350 [Desulfurococcales archaeon]|nr:hypothetical protein [Desulfurococcales archaeon]